MSNAEPAHPCSKSHMRAAVLRYEMAEIRRRFIVGKLDFNKLVVSSDLDRVFWRCLESAMSAREVIVAEAAAIPDKIETPTLQWLALALTPGLGPSKAR